ncbi:MAG: ATP-binding protein [Bauldia sp.]
MTAVLVAISALVAFVLWAAGLAHWAGALLAFFAAALALAVQRAGPRPAASVAAVREPAAPPPDGSLTRVADALPDPAFLIGPRGVVTHANPPAIAAFALRPGDLVTARLRAPEMVAALSRVAAGGDPERVAVFERVPTERWFSAWIARLGPAGSGPLLLIVHDETHRHLSDRMRVDFVANASHELRTPLASLSGFIETLQGRAKDDPQARQRFLAIMHDQATRMSRLIDDLLSLSRIEMKEHVRPRDPVDLVAVARAAVDAMEPLAAEMGVKIETSLPERPVVVPADRDEIVEVLNNLVENACKYGRSGGRAIVSVATDGGNAVLSVRDFGPGIPREHLPRLTERFYRVGESAERGTGLGLAIVKHIATRHRARLEIDSREGEGATFRLRFGEIVAAPVAAAAS